MTSAMDLLKAPEYGIKDFKAHISQRIKTKKPIVLLGSMSKKVILEYDELVELMELLEDLKDKKLLDLLESGKTAPTRNEKEVNAAESIRQIRAKRT